ncbi:MAG: EthD domain-containing protein [Actinomycetota bacterium]
MKIIAAVPGAPPPTADFLYLPIEEGVSGRDDPVSAIAVYRSEDPPLPDGAEAYRVDEQVQWERGDAAVTRISFVRRPRELTHEDFAFHWTQVHAPLARRHHPGICRYVQNVVVHKLTPGGPDVDGIAELGFASLDDFRERMYDSPEGQEIIAADVREFIDVTAGWRMLARPAAT